MTNYWFQNIKDATRQRGGNIFLNFSSPSNPASVSYADMEALSARCANALIARGVRAGDRVAAQIEKSADAVTLYFAAVRAGAVFLPLNPAYTEPEVEYLLSDAEPRLLICDPQRHDALAKLAAKSGIGSVETLGGHGEGSLPALCAAMPASFEDTPRAADDLAAILYTSGTTGRPKGAMLTHGNLASNAAALARLWRFSPDDVLLHALPLYHTHGLFVGVNTVALSGGAILLLSKFEPGDCLKAMERATVMMGVPTYYTRLLADPGLSRERAAHMRLFICGSAPLLAETHAAFFEKTGHVILERYGMTETNMITSNPYEGERRPGTVGFPLPGVELRIADPETGRALAPRETGVIEVNGPNVFKGYWRRSEKNAREFREDGYFITSDLGRVDEDGYVHILGRTKDLIISGGLNVYPKEVESEINALAGVLESAVIGLPHGDFGEAVVAIVEVEPGVELDERMMTATLTARLAKFKLPKRLIFVAELPRNAMGKVQKNLLRETYNDLFFAGME
ncbi:MAG TPA: malonyl-CoA synthase [Methylocella sp.]|nr:malonyl-CoA synthase [Methylocella sp.]